MSLAKRFTHMVAATITAIDPSSTLAIADGQPFAHDSVYRVLNEERFCFFLALQQHLTGLGRTMLALNRLKAVGAMTGGHLVLDDSFILRYSSGKFDLKKLKDSAHNRYAHGFNVVLLIWTNGTIRIPVGFKLFLAQKGEASKIDLALELLEEARGMGLRPKYVLFDAWYSAQSILNWVDQAGWLYVTQLRKNRLLDNAPVNVDRRPYWVKVGKLNKVRTSVIVFRQGKRYLVSNDVRLDRAAIQRVYRFRQNVEEAYRSCKQELGWEGMRFRTRQTLESHLGLTLAAYAVIEAERSVLKLSFYKLRRGLVSGRVSVPNIVLNEVILAA